MRRLLAFLGGLAICAALVPNASWAQSNPPASDPMNMQVVKIEADSERVEAEHKSVEAPAKQVGEEEAEFLGEYLKKAGGHLKKARKTYSPGPKTLGWIAEEENPYVGLILTFIVLPFDFTFTRAKGKFVASHHFGLAGEQFIGASTVIPPQQAPLMEIAGKDLKAYRTLGYLSNGLFYSGLLAGAVEAARVYGGALALSKRK